MGEIADQIVDQMIFGRPTRRRYKSPEQQELDRYARDRQFRTELLRNARKLGQKLKTKGYKA